MPPAGRTARLTSLRITTSPCAAPVLIATFMFRLKTCVVIAARKREKSLMKNDLDLEKWREYDEVWTDSLWLIEERAKDEGHELDGFHGGFVPQIPRQLLYRYTQKNDIVLDPFLGSGTTAIECLAQRRRCVGVDLNLDSLKNLGRKHKSKRLRLVHGDSMEYNTWAEVDDHLRDMGCDRAQLLILHPPYHDIVKFTPYKADLSRSVDLPEFRKRLAQVVERAVLRLDPGRVAAMVIGDIYQDKRLYPLGLWGLEIMAACGLQPKAIVVKDIVGNERGKGKAGNLWRYRALAGGFFVFKHEYILIMTREG